MLDPLGMAALLWVHGLVVLGDSINWDPSSGGEAKVQTVGSNDDGRFVAWLLTQVPEQASGSL
jgi:hypothetical protein